MMKDRQDPRTGAKQRQMGEQVVDETEVIANHDAESELHGAASRNSADRRIEGLLRIIGLQDGNDRDLTEDEAELIFDIMSAEPMTEEQLARIRGGVLRRRFGTTPVIDQSATEEPASVTSSAVEAPVPSSRAGPDTTRWRPSLVQHCKSVKRKLADVATELRLDRQTLFELDRGAAQSVPRALIEAAATALKLERDEVARCLAPGGEEMPRMAAHGRPGAQASKPARRREFLDVIEASRLPDDEKRYWREVVAAESAASERPSENS